MKMLSDAQVLDVLLRDPKATLGWIETFYTSVHQTCVSPDQTFIHYPETRSRFIAMSASVPDSGVAGVKFISSFPDNIRRGLDRAHAILNLFSMKDGTPIAVLEANHLTRCRTVLGFILVLQKWQHYRENGLKSLSLIGSGRINQALVEWMHALGIRPSGAVCLYDPLPRQYERLEQTMVAQGWPSPRHATSAQECLSASSVVSIATSEISPHLQPPALAEQLIFHASLRDIYPTETLLEWPHVVDDPVVAASGHGTSLGLACAAFQKDRKVATVARVLSDAGRLQGGVIMAPFGLAALDIYSARRILDAFE